MNLNHHGPFHYVHLAANKQYKYYHHHQQYAKIYKTLTIASVFDFLSPSYLVLEFLYPVQKSLFPEHLLCLWCPSPAPEFTITPYQLSQVSKVLCLASRAQKLAQCLTQLFALLLRTELLVQIRTSPGLTEAITATSVPVCYIKKNSINNGYVQKVFSNLFQSFLFLL